MSGLFTEPGLGLERLAREALVILMDNLDQAITEQEQYWEPLDHELATKRGVPYVPATIERIAPENFYLGHRDSLLQAPMTALPNIAVMAYRATPSIEQATDFTEAYSDRMFVEIMCKAESEELVNQRTQRTTEAVNNVLRRNQSFNGLLAGDLPGPEVTITDVVSRREKKGSGSLWWWQGSRLDYTITKHSTFDSF